MALFCDEAGKDTDRFLAVGGLSITSENSKHVKTEIARHYKRLQINSEMKWNKTKKGNSDKYHEMVHYFFQLIEDEVISFHCLLIDFDRFDHNLRLDGGPKESLKRMYYQLILHRLCKKHPNCDLYAFPDKSGELDGLSHFKDVLNIASRQKFGYKRDCLKAIEFRDSEKETLLQLNDIVLGGVCYQKNKRFEAQDAGQSKANLAGYILGKSGLANYEFDTPWSQKKFTIWNLKSQYLKGGA